MTVSAFSYFQHLCSVSVLFPCFYPNQVLPTFHCKVKELLVLCEGFGGKGHSGAEPWVVKLTGSEQDPFTELYIAYTLETVFKWVINVLRVTVALPQPQYLSTKAPQIPPINDRLFTDYPYFTSFIQECKKNHSRRGTVFCANIPTDYWVILIIFSSHQYFLAYCQASAHCGKILLEIQQKKGISFNAWFTLDPHVPRWVQVSAGLLPWVQSSSTQASTFSGPPWTRTNTGQQHW